MHRVYARYVVGLCLSLSLLASGLARADAPEQLAARLADTESASGRFVQTVTAGSSASQVSRGQFRLLRPSYFAWEIDAPDSQLLIADTEYLWHFDRDLETVTRRPIATQGQATPLQVLGGDVAALRDNYAISSPSTDTFALTPLAAGQGFKQLQLKFDGAQLLGMEIIDNLNQRIVIEFSDVALGGLTAADFAFSPPEGADLFVYDE